MKILSASPEETADGAGREETPLTNTNTFSLLLLLQDVTGTFRKTCLYPRLQTTSFEIKQ